MSPHDPSSSRHRAGEYYSCETWPFVPTWNEACSGRAVMTVLVLNCREDRYQALAMPHKKPNGVIGGRVRAVSIVCIKTCGQPRCCITALLHARACENLSSQPPTDSGHLTPTWRGLAPYLLYDCQPGGHITQKHA